VSNDSFDKDIDRMIENVLSSLLILMSLTLTLEPSNFFEDTARIVGDKVVSRPILWS
jgi:hypothetical protein